LRRSSRGLGTRLTPRPAPIGTGLRSMRECARVRTAPLGISILATPISGSMRCPTVVPSASARAMSSVDVRPRLWPETLAHSVSHAGAHGQRWGRYRIGFLPGREQLAQIAVRSQASWTEGGRPRHRRGAFSTGRPWPAHVEQAKPGESPAAHQPGSKHRSRGVSLASGRSPKVDLVGWVVGRRCLTVPELRGHFQ